MSEKTALDVRGLVSIVKRNRIPEWLFIVIASIGLGLAWFLILYGKYTLYFTHVYWIYSTGRDPLQHQLGWEFFRNESWRFPLGLIRDYGYPYGTTVTFMDSIPLFAFFFKLLSPWLSENFQYFGLWELTSVICQMAVGLLIMREFTKSNLVKVLGASMLVLSPAMIYRAYYHSSLSAHWILLLAILFVILEYRNRMKNWYWLALFSLAMLVHLYYIPMLIPLWGVGLLFRYQREHKKRILLFEPLKIIVIILGIGFCTGIFGLSFSELSQIGFGDYSWNLNGFFNPFDTSRFFKGLPYQTPQDEGFSYLGAGNFILLSFAFVFFIIKDAAKRNWKFFLPFAVISVGFMLLALSERAMVNDQIIWDFTLFEPLRKLVSLFRSTGRFIWPVYYFILIFGVAALVRNFRYAWPILILAIIIQFVDIQPLLETKRVPGLAEYGAGGMKSDFWQEAGKTNTTIEIIPTEYYEHLAVYAVRHHMTISSGYFGRADIPSMESLSQKTWQELLAGKSDDKTLYVLSDPIMVTKAYQDLTQWMYVCKIDKYDVVFSKDNPVTKSEFDFSSVCLIP